MAISKKLEIIYCSNRNACRNRNRCYAKKTKFKFRQHSAKRLLGQARTSQRRHSMRQKFVFTPFYQMLRPWDRQNCLSFFYRNNTREQKYIVPNIVPNKVLDIVPIM